MKIAIIGGAGVFGRRLAELLIRDGHDVLICGRSDPGATAQQLNAKALRLDRAGDLQPLWSAAPDVVVDAAGPFHAYGNDPYRLAREAILRGIHYLDLADDADFCAGITSLNEAARKAGVIALSGVSSVPALSSSVIASLADGADEIDTIRVAILPGNRAPRGRSVVSSILHQVGRPINVRIDGRWTVLRSWSNPLDFEIGDGQHRTGYLIRVPDLDLLPDHFDARTVTFHAGLDLPVQNRALAAWSWLRAWSGAPAPTWFVGFVHWGAGLLERFGHDSGAMVVEVTGRWGDHWLRRQWRLMVRDGHGPYIPGVPARAILRHLEKIAPGARPALEVLSRHQMLDAMSDLPVSFGDHEQHSTPLFPQVLRAAFDGLPAEVRASHAVHGPIRLSGRGSVERGKGVWPNLIATLFRFPAATEDIDVEVVKTPGGEAEVWTRRFGKQVFRSTLRRGRRGMTEQFGALTFDLDLQVRDGALLFPVKAGRIGPIPLPRWLLPRSDARESAQDGSFRFDVALYAPITGQLMVHYRGWLSRQGSKE